MRHLILLPALALATILSAQTSTPSATTKKTAPRHRRTVKHKPAGPTVSQQIEDLKQAVLAQQQQLDGMRQQLAQRDQQLQAVQAQAQQASQAVSAAQQAQSSADQANQKAEQVAQTVQTTNQEVETVKANAVTTNSTIQEEQKRVGALESPAAIHFKGVTLTPGGFLAAEGVWRQHATAADVNSSFNAINFPGSASYHQSEFFGSGRGSRLALLAEGKFKGGKATGYYEADFLSAGVTSNNNESNSYTLRQRNAFLQAALDSGWTITGGQQWSLVTETKTGLANRTEALPMTVDYQYTVGFSWARQLALRITKDFGKRVFAGVSVEDPQTLVTTHGNLANFNIGQPGLTGGLYNSLANYSNNLAPDVIAKVAFEPGFGHYEIFGIVSQFRDRIYPAVITGASASTAGAFNDSKTGGGVGANARAVFFNKHLETAVHVLGGSGVGRYGTSVLSDATIRPDGRYSLLKNYMGYGTLEYHSTHWDWYGYGGAEYAGRSFFTRTGTTPGSVVAVGYGSPLFNNSGCLVETVPGSATGFVPGAPANCNNDTRAIVEGTLGFWYKFYNGPKGRLQMGGQYSYLTRALWNGVGGAPHTVENQALTSFRYYLP